MARGKQHVRFFSRVGNFDYGYRHLDLLGYFLFQDWFDRCRAGYYHDVRYSLVSRDHSRSMGSRFGKR